MILKDIRLKKSGFTLIDLMITLGIVAILLAMAIPDIKSWLSNYRLNIAARDIALSMQLAKMKAISINNYVSISFINVNIGGTTYDYALYVDQDKDLEYDDGEQAIKNVKLSDYKGVSFDTSVRGDGVTFANNCLAFDSMGLPKNKTGGFGAGSIYLENTRNKGKKVVVSSVGRISIVDYK